MAFILGADTRIVVQPVGMVFVFRDPTEDERKDYDKRFARLINAPGLDANTAAGAEKLGIALRRLKKEFAAKLLKDWGEYNSKPGVPVPFSEKTVAAFFADYRTRRIWEPAWQQYWNPTASVQELDTGDEALPEPSFQGSSQGG